MRILTVRQPWAWAIIQGKKHVENRVRNIAGDYRGPVAIHVAQADAENAPEWVWQLHADFYREQYGRVDPSWRGTDRGRIIGVANLWAVHEHDGSERFNCCPNAPDRYQRWAQPNVWHLCFAAPQPLREPIPYRGALGLRDLAVRDPETVLAITRQIGVAS